MRLMEFVYSIMLLVVLLLANNHIGNLESKLKTYSIVSIEKEVIIVKISRELTWYKEQSQRILGKNFKLGNLMSTTINLSSYNPVEEQCDSTPLIASDNGLVTPGILALPKHYRLDLGFELGQIVWIPPYGQFIVRDHMHSRKAKGRGDIISFIPEWSKKFGINNIATMYWFTGG